MPVMNSPLRSASSMATREFPQSSLPLRTACQKTTLSGLAFGQPLCRAVSIRHTVRPRIALFSLCHPRALPVVQAPQLLLRC